MAAVVILARRNAEGDDDEAERKDDDGNGRISRGPGKNDGHGGDGVNGSGSMDLDGDGNISVEELQRKLCDVSIRTDILCKRMELEREVFIVLIKMPFFLTCLLCFLMALLEFSPAEEVAKVHKHLETHFELEESKGFKSYNDIYDYILKFEHHNEELQATSALYWCERRYFDRIWDNTLLTPTKICHSPRLKALHLGDPASRMSWNEWHSGRRRGHGPSDGRVPGDPSDSLDEDSESSGHAGDASASSTLKHRRRVQARRLGSTTGSLSRPPPPCEDDDEILRSSSDLADGATCNSSASEVCETDIGLFACPKTCGFCAPFVYERVHKFPKPQLTMLPVVIYQTRFQKADCHGFAEVYNKQESNPVLNFMPALDGIRADDTITCFDRTKHYKGEWAAEVECDENSAEYFCKPCSYNQSATCVREARRVNFIGRDIYPIVLVEPARDIQRLKSIDYLDVQTETVSLSTVVYTEGLEIFTSLTIELSIDAAGNILQHRKMISYRDLTNSSKTTFIVCLIVCSAIALVAVILSVFNLYQNPQECRWGLQVFELLSRSILCVYPLVLLITWTQQKPMSYEYDLLLHAFLDIEGFNPGAFSVALKEYFRVKTEIYEETSWLKRHRVCSNAVFYLQFWQLMLYFSCHPKMAMLTDTIALAITNLVHFLFLFMVLFLMMAFMAHWQLGEYIKSFSTFGDTVSSQARMIFGEFIYAEGTEQLHGVMMFMYWLYAFTFLLVIWGLLLNFFLAIVVDAFVTVNTASQSSDVVGNFFSDVVEVIEAGIKSGVHGWPSRKQMIQFLRELQRQETENEDWLERLKLDAVDDDDLPIKRHTITPERLREQYPDSFPSDYKLAVFVFYYFQKFPGILRRREGLRRSVMTGAHVDANVSTTSVTPAQLADANVAKQLQTIVDMNLKILAKHKELETRQEELFRVFVENRVDEVNRTFV